MQALAAIVAGRRDDEDALLIAIGNGIQEELVGLRRATELATADVDDVSASVDGQTNGSREINLGRRSQPTIRMTSEHGNNKSATFRSDPAKTTAVPREYLTDDVRAVLPRSWRTRVGR